MNNDPAARRLQVFADPAALARAAAEELTRRAVAAVRSGRPASIALSGGSTPKALYALLADEPAFRERLPWAQTHFFFGDERHVPPDHKDSNFRMAREAMFDKLGDLVPAANIHRIHGEEADAAKAAADYGREITTFDGSGLLRFDLVLLGMGPEGHTASIFPGTTPLRETAPVVSVYVEKMMTYRITFTPPLLNNSAAIMFLVAGQDKGRDTRRRARRPFRARPSAGAGDQLHGGWRRDALAARPRRRGQSARSANRVRSSDGVTG